MNSLNRYRRIDPAIVKIKLIIFGTFVLTGLALLIHYSH